MAQTRYGNVYFQEAFAGELREKPDGRFTFTYRLDYLESGNPAIAFTLPLQLEPIYSRGGLHSFFDNLVSEGWLANAQGRALGIRTTDRFSRLLAFGRDCAGAVSVLDPCPRFQPDLHVGSADEIAALSSRASISGVQPKLMALRTGASYRPARPNAPGTHIAKLRSSNLPGIVDLEYLTTIAASRLLDGDRFVDMEIASVEGVQAPALLVRRFDRSPGGPKIHFEEFNQLLDRPSEALYEGSYAAMADFIRANPRCELADIDVLFRRILACILVGNTDAHMKNFGMLYEGCRMRLAPLYDFVAGVLYPATASHLALRIGDGPNPPVATALGPTHLEALAKSLGMGRGALLAAVHDLGVRLDAACQAVDQAPFGKASLKNQLIQFMRKRWDGAFKSMDGNIDEDARRAPARPV